VLAAGDIQKAVQRLQKALLIDPDFPEAHSDLAAIYAQMGRIEEGLHHAQAAFNLNPQLPEAGRNLALLLVKLKRYPEAEIVTRRMLNGRYNLPVLHGVLAVSLIEQREDVNEALGHLQQAVGEFPFVRLMAARALGDVGRFDLAVIQAGEYLQSSANESERPALEAWVASIQSQLTSDE